MLTNVLALEGLYNASDGGGLCTVLRTHLSVQRHEEVRILFGPRGQTNIMNLLVGALLSPKVEISKVLKKSTTVSATV